MSKDTECIECDLWLHVSKWHVYTTAAALVHQYISTSVSALTMLNAEDKASLRSIRIFLFCCISILNFRNPLNHHLEKYKYITSQEESPSVLLIQYGRHKRTTSLGLVDDALIIINTTIINFILSHEMLWVRYQGLHGPLLLYPCSDKAKPINGPAWAVPTCTAGVPYNKRSVQLGA